MVFTNIRKPINGNAQHAMTIAVSIIIGLTTYRSEKKLEIIVKNMNLLMKNIHFHLYKM